MVTVRLGYVRPKCTPVLYIGWHWDKAPKFFVTMPEFQTWARTLPQNQRRAMVFRYGGW